MLHAQTYSITGLERNITMPIPHDDRAIDDPMWDSPEFDFFTGWVVLDDEFVAEKGLPTPMRWPWDNSKSIYMSYTPTTVSIACSFFANP
ncbi:hypothetical protein EAF04_000629 [Stromatinia cepivora]|nr:hypothetical protein EAF04_000629 [Stromatinia cepivora]